MKILEVLSQDAILTDLKATDKRSVIEELSTPLAVIGNLDHAELVRVLQERERLGSTGIGKGIGIPHGKLPALDKLLLGFGISRQGVDFESMDRQPTYLFFLLLTPENTAGLHLRLLARISRLLKDDVFRNQLLKARRVEEVTAIIRSVDEEF
jgi:PTS system nitrogen regulatory IIA component